MNTTGNNLRRSLLLSVTVALLLAFAVGVHPRRDAGALAGVRKSAPQTHFMSGGERSEKVLAEILATLKRMDARLARIEKMGQQSLQQQHKEQPPR